MLKTRFVYGNNDALLEISSAHDFGACTNVSCWNLLKAVQLQPDIHVYLSQCGSYLLRLTTVIVKLRVVLSISID